ncbi:MAG: PhoU domain-containing protein [Thermodesulfobacteriota bacterium]
MLNNNVIKEPNFELEILRMCESTKEMFELTFEGFRKLNKERLSQAEEIGQEIHLKEKTLVPLIIAALSKSREPTRNLELLSLVPTHLERIGDNIELLIRCSNSIIEDGICFSDKALKEINMLFENLTELLQYVGDIIKTNNKVLVTHVLEEIKNFQEIVNEYSIWHYDRLIEGSCLPKASSSYLALIDYLSEIASHIKWITRSYQ